MKSQKEIEKGCKCNSKTGEPCGIVGELKFNLCPSCQALLNYNQEVIKMIEEYILTDLQGHPLPEVKVLREIIQKLKGAEK